MPKSLQTIASEIGVELRSILRQLRDLRTPIQRFERDARRAQDAPQFYVMFDMHARMSIAGLRLQSAMVSLPDERIIDQVLELAKSVWHLKDRLQQWVKVCSPLARKGIDKSGVDTWAKQSDDLLICCDLAIEKKHGGNENRSGKKPTIAQVEFDTSQSGVFEFYIDGSTGAKELVVTHPVPIAYRVPVSSEVDGGVIGEAVETLERAFKHWIPLVEKVGLLDLTDPQTVALRAH